MRKWNEVLKQGQSEKKKNMKKNPHCVILFWSIWYYSRQKSNRAWWHLGPQSEWTILYTVCLYNTEREQTVIPMDKRVCLASKLGYLVLAKNPFSLNNVRGECEKDAWMREEHSCNKTVNLSTVLWEQWCCTDREMYWTSPTDAMSRKYYDRNDRLSSKL